MKPLVVYEDQLAQGASPNNYAPHLLALACVVDRLGPEAPSLRELSRRVECYPCKGSGNVRKYLPRLAEDRVVVVALDSDRVRTLYDLAPGTPEADVIQQIKEEARSLSLEAGLLERNLEDVIRFSCRARGVADPVGKPRPAERDRLLHQLIQASARKRAVFLELMPLFGRLVTLVAELRGLASQRPAPTAR